MEQIIKCRGRGFDGEEVLFKPIKVKIEIHAIRESDAIYVSVFPICPYNTGSHGQRCKASHLRQEKVGDGVLCPFSFDYPHALQFEDWELPKELKKAFRELGIIP